MEKYYTIFFFEWFCRSAANILSNWKFHFSSFTHEGNEIIFAPATFSLLGASREGCLSSWENYHFMWRRLPLLSHSKARFSGWATTFFTSFFSHYPSHLPHATSTTLKIFMWVFDAIEDVVVARQSHTDDAFKLLRVFGWIFFLLFCGRIEDLPGTLWLRHMKQHHDWDVSMNPKRGNILSQHKCRKVHWKFNIVVRPTLSQQRQIKSRPVRKLFIAK